MPGFSTPYDPPIPATDIHDGSVSNAEFGCLNGVTSAIQTQLDGKAATSHGHAISDVTGLQSALDGKSSTSHDHSGVYEATGAVSTHAAATSGVHGISSFAATILDDTDAATVRGTIGLGSIATQSAGSVAITGGTISGITDLAIADGGTGASSASAARANLSVYSSAEVDTLLSETAGELQPLDATLTALAGWNWFSGVEIAALTAANTRGVLRVGTGANNLVQLTSDGKLPAVDGSLLTGIAGGGASNLDGLSDVTITAAASGDFLRHNGTAWVDATISASDIPSGVDATKIGGGAVSNTEFSYLDGVTSAIQTQLDAKAAAAAYEYAWPSDTVEAFTSGTYKAILTTSSLAVGCYEITALINTRRAAAATIWTRFIAGTASLAGSVNDALGHAMLEGSTITQVNLSSTSPWTTTAPGRFSSGDGATHLWRIAFEVTSAGTVSLQMAFNTTNNVTIEKGSVVTIRKVS